MSAIWGADDIKDKLLLLSPNLQETFLRAVDALHSRESTCMLTFIKESRNELQDTHHEIVREQEVLRDTSDLLASKRMYGDPDEWEDNTHNMTAVEDYLKRRNQGFIGNVTFENEHRAHKKAKKKDKDRDKEKEKEKDKSHKSRRPHSHAGELRIEDEEEKHKKKKDKKDKKDREGKEEKEKEEEKERDNPEKEKKKKKHKEKDRERDENDKEAKIRREKSAPVLIGSPEPDDVEKVTQDLMQEYISRQRSDIQARDEFEEAIKAKLARKKNRHVAEADELLRQQAWADEELGKEKAAYEVKMMEKLRSRRERSGVVGKSMDTTADNDLEDNETVITDLSEKPKKEKKKKKKKEKDEEAKSDAEDKERHSEKKKEKKKKKKKSKEKDQEDD